MGKTTGSEHLSASEVEDFASANDPILRSRVAGDAFERLRIEADGTIVTGDGTAAPDTAVGGASGASGTAKVVEFTFTEVATSAKVSTFAVTGATSGLGGTFTFAGDRRLDFARGVTFTVAGSTGNDGTYTVASTSLSGGDTIVIVNETLASAVGDGTASITAGLYTATFAVETGMVIEAVYGPVLALWAAAADYARVNVNDDVGEYITDFDLSTAVAYDVVPLGDSSGLYPTWSSDTGSYSSAFISGGVSPDGEPVGRRYTAPNTITMRVTTQIASPPVVPTGELLMRIKYRDAVTPTAAAVLVA